MDQAHRPCIHKTYTESARIYTDPNCALSLTRFPVGPFKFLVLLTDVRLGPGLFYQSYCLFSLIYVHGILTNTADQMVYEWYIASPWYLKFLHPFLSRKIWNVNHVQIAEDVPIRKRRAELRKKGYIFGPQPDFLTSNTMTPNTSAPAFSGELSFDLNGLEPLKLTKIQSGPLELLARLESSGKYRLWNSVCPHEGGPLGEGKLCGPGEQDLLCPWHHLRFSGAQLSEQSPQARLGNLQLTLERAQLRVRISEIER